jgi:hypothetical protein
LPSLPHVRDGGRRFAFPPYGLGWGVKAGWYKMKEESSSFLKKRTKKRLIAVADFRPQLT